MHAIAAETADAIAATTCQLVIGGLHRGTCRWGSDANIATDAFDGGWVQSLFRTLFWFDPGV